ncbi:MFS transporter [Agromyces sp. MMS24-K17]|uniref:MFS transporter n=1 Tax=Agromyces sp. MMS24-K17 TaxID=3372850 RepID=UPI0037540CA9
MTVATPSPSTRPSPVVAADPSPGVSRRIVVALALAVLAYSLMQTLLVPALPVFADGFGLDAAGSGWVLTSYLLSGAVAAPILGSLGDRFGHRRLLVVSLVVFAVGGVVCALAPGFGVLLAGRVLQGASTATFPLALAIVRRHLPAAGQRTAVGWLSGTIGLGAGVALVLGGLIVQLLSWPWLFILGTGLGLLALLLVMRWVPASHRGAGTRTDWVGGALLVVGLLALLLAVSQGGKWGWTSPVTLLLAVVAAAGIAGLVLVELRVAQPLVDMRVLARPVLLLTNGLTLFLGFVPYLFYVGLPVLLESGTGAGHGLDVATAGLVMLPSAVLVFLGGRMAPALATRMRTPVVAALSMALMGLGAAGAALAPSSLIAVIGSFALLGLGQGVGFAVVAELVSQLAPRSEVASAVAVNGVLRTVGSALGAPITALFLVDAAVGAGEFAALFAFAALVSMVGVVLAGFIRPRA